MKRPHRWRQRKNEAAQSFRKAVRILTQKLGAGAVGEANSLLRQTDKAMRAYRVSNRDRDGCPLCVEFTPLVLYSKRPYINWLALGLMGNGSKYLRDSAERGKQVLRVRDGEHLVRPGRTY